MKDRENLKKEIEAINFAPLEKALNSYLRWYESEKIGGLCSMVHFSIDCIRSQLKLLRDFLDAMK